MTKPWLLNWVGGEHQVALGMGQLRALQDATDAGPEEILRRMTDGTWRLDDIMSILVQGLIGGGMDALRARKLTSEMFNLYPLYAFKEPAYRVLASALVGPADDQLGEAMGALNPPDDGNSAKSTAPVQ